MKIYVAKRGTWHGDNRHASMMDGLCIGEDGFFFGSAAAYTKLVLVKRCQERYGDAARERYGEDIEFEFVNTKHKGFRQAVQTMKEIEQEAESNGT